MLALLLTPNAVFCLLPLVDPETFSQETEHILNGEIQDANGGVRDSKGHLCTS